MTAVQFVGVLVRLAGLALLVTVVRQQAPLLSTYLRAEVGSWDALYFGGLLLIVILCVAMVLFPRTVAAGIIPDTPDAEARFDWSLGDFQRTLFGALGLYFVVEGVSDLVHAYTSYRGTLVIMGQQRIQPQIPDFIVTQSITAAVETGLGVLIFVGAGALVRLFQRIRAI